MENGSVSYAQTTTPFSLRGDNLHILLNYGAVSQSYDGRINVAPLIVNRAAEPPLSISIDLPINIDRNGIRLNNGRLISGSSQVSIAGSLVNVNAPKIALRSHAKISLQDLQKDLGSGFANLDLDAQFDQPSSTLSLHTLHLDLGASQLNASGNLNPATNEAVTFDSTLILTELSHYLKLSSPKMSGSLQLAGTANLDAQRNYQINGNLNSQGLSITSGSTHLSNVGLSTPFQITPQEVSLNPIRLTAFGGVLSGRLLLEQFRKLTAQAELSGISISAITSALAGYPLRYGSTLSGSVSAETDLKAKGDSHLVSKAHLMFSPRNDGVPLSGSLEAQYLAANNEIEVSNSTISFPHSRLTVAGSVNRNLDANVTSFNLDDFLPLANFGSSKPTSHLPLQIRTGGVAKLSANVEGGLTNPQIKTHLAITKFAIQKNGFDSLSLDAAASPSGVSIHNGSLDQASLRSTFDGSIGLSHWKLLGSSPLSANVTLRNAGLDSLLALANPSNIEAGGLLNADIHVNGTYGDPLGAATLLSKTAALMANRSPA